MRDVQKGATLSPVLSAVEGTGETGGVPQSIFYPLPEKEGPRKDSDTHIGGNKGMDGSLINVL